MRGSHLSTGPLPASVPAAAGTDRAGRAGGSGAGVRGTRVAVALAVLLVAGFFGARLASHDWRPGAFVVAGDGFVDPDQRPELPVAAGSDGYDGQFVYRLALDPLTDQVGADGIVLDNPPYRQGRIGLPALGWLVDRLPGVPLTVALLLIEAAALVGCGWLGIRFAVACGRHPLVGLVVGLSPGLVIAAARDLTEPLAVFLLLAGLDLWRRRRLAAAAALFAASALTRETVLVVLGGMGAWHLFGWLRQRTRAYRGSAAGAPRSPAAAALPAEVGRPAAAALPTAAARPVDTALPAWAARPADRLPAESACAADAPRPADRLPPDHLARAAVLLVPLVATVGWHACVRSVWGGWPSAAKGGDNFGTPLLRPLHGLLAGLDRLLDTDRQHLLQHLWLAERCALLALLLVVVGTLARSTLAPDLRVGWLAAALVAVSMAWGADVQFVRTANEAIVVGLMVLVAGRGRWPVAGLWLAAGWSAAVAVTYAVAL